MILFKGKIASWYRLRLKFKPLTTSENIYIAKHSVIAERTQIGRGTRINGKIIIKGRGDCTIGNYCALGGGIRIITSNHDTEEPVLQYALLKRMGVDLTAKGSKDVLLGDNVWIGDGAIILPGVTIGSHSIVAAGAIVTKDVPEFAIVGGNPAKLIRHRLNESDQKTLKSIDWELWPEQKIISWLHKKNK